MNSYRVYDSLKGVSRSSADIMIHKWAKIEASTGASGASDSCDIPFRVHQALHEGEVVLEENITAAVFLKQLYLVVLEKICPIVDEASGKLCSGI